MFAFLVYSFLACNIKHLIEYTKHYAVLFEIKYIHVVQAFSLDSQIDKFLILYTINETGTLNVKWISCVFCHVEDIYDNMYWHVYIHILRTFN